MIMDFCYQGYMLSGGKKWIQRAANVLHVHKGRELKLSFQAGIFLEGMRRYYEMSRDEEALAYIKASVDRLIATGKKGGVTAQAHSFMYLKTEERKYLDAALDNLPQSGQFGNPWKQFALSMRNAAMCIGDLHHSAQMLPSDGGYVHHNTIVLPAKWVLRILQESSDVQFTPCHDGIFERNLIIFDSKVQTFMNVGPRTSPETFRFQHNAWLDLDRHREPSLPVPEKESICLRDTSIDRTTLIDAKLDLDDDRVKGIGAQAYKRAR